MTEDPMVRVVVGASGVGLQVASVLLDLEVPVEAVGIVLACRCAPDRVTDTRDVVQVVPVHPQAPLVVVDRRCGKLRQTPVSLDLSG
eukprot:CAMPEP_0195066296 /NCGR_PEP_ID=MMETSP0448-20130528/11689_1 /TAXON_ID=66468 /ORGANISM="Heterocapsa triquestra, Strain CCMP 448" /LENGTH=86 /DNA_ID=CAMNT_0040097523 /DNA_START=268 /DNA_END=524 /DNA_ORIENTATION=+